MVAAIATCLCAVAFSEEQPPDPTVEDVEALLSRTSIQLMYQLQPYSYSWLESGHLKGGQVLILPPKTRVTLKHGLSPTQCTLIGEGLAQPVNTPFGSLQMTRHGVATEELRGPCVFICRRTEKEKGGPDCSVVCIEGKVITGEYVREPCPMACSFERIGVAGVIKAGMRDDKVLRRLKEEWSGKTYFIPEWKAGETAASSPPAWPDPDPQLGYLSYAKVQLIHLNKQNQTPSFVMEVLFLSAIKKPEESIPDDVHGTRRKARQGK